MRVKCIGTLGVIAMRQGDIATNKVSDGKHLVIRDGSY